ncbi:MAG: glycosyltransferase [Parvularculaceae bacterium]
MIDVSVIVPHFNQMDLLARCLDSLERQTIDRGRYEVIVADNGTPGGIEDLKALYPDVRFTIALERGAAPARNAALALATGNAIAFTDADCTVAPDWLHAGLIGLEGADLCGGQVIVTAADERRLSPVEAFERVFAFRQRDYVERKSFAATANLFVRRRCADAIGPFTNGLSEDVDWCRRGVALGFRLAFNDRSIVRHPARRDWSELVRKWDRIILERWNGFQRTTPGRRALWLVLAAATALSAAPHLLRVLVSPKLERLGDRFAAASVLTRIRVWRAVRMTNLLRAG